MAVSRHFHQQEVVTGEVVEFRVVSHFHPRRREYLDTMTDMSTHAF